MAKTKPLSTIADIEGCMAHVMMQPSYPATLAEYRRLLEVMGNVDGDEVVALVIVSFLEAKGPKR